MTVKIFIRFCKNIETFVMESINILGDFCFVQGGIFQNR